MDAEQLIAFAETDAADGALRICVNFGVFAGREATPAEIEELAARLRPTVDNVSIVAEQRHEIGVGREASVHQIRVEVPPSEIPPGEGVRASLSELLVESAERWARECIAARHAEIAEL